MRRSRGGYAYEALPDGRVKIEGELPMDAAAAERFLAAAERAQGIAPLYQQEPTWTPEEIERDRLDMAALDRMIESGADI